MSYTTTPLGQQLAIPNTGQAFETTVVNANLLLLENAIGDVAADLATTDGVVAGHTSDISDLESAVEDIPDIIISNTPMTAGAPTNRVRLF